MEKVIMAATKTFSTGQKMHIEAKRYDEKVVKRNTIIKFRGNVLTRQLKQKRNMIVVKVRAKAIQYKNL